MLNTKNQDKNNEVELQRNRFLWLWLAPMSFYGYALIVVGPFIPIIIAALMTILHVKVGGYKNFFRLPSHVLVMYVIATLMPVTYLFYSVFFKWKDRVEILVILYFLSLIFATLFVIFYKKYFNKSEILANHT